MHIAKRETKKMIAMCQVITEHAELSSSSFSVTSAFTELKQFIKKSKTINKYCNQKRHRQGVRVRSRYEKQ